MFQPKKCVTSFRAPLTELAIIDSTQFIVNVTWHSFYFRKYILSNMKNEVQNLHNSRFTWTERIEFMGTVSCNWTLLVIYSNKEHIFQIF